MLARMLQDRQTRQTSVGAPAGVLRRVAEKKCTASALDSAELAVSGLTGTQEQIVSCRRGTVSPLSCLASALITQAQVLLHDVGGYERLLSCSHLRVF